MDHKFTRSLYCMRACACVCMPIATSPAAGDDFILTQCISLAVHAVVCVSV